VVNGLKRNLWIAAALVAVVGISASARVRHSARATAPPKVTAAQIEAGKSFGVKTAPIRIDEYSDFECPHCQELYLSTLRPLIDDYVSSGKVFLVHHDFPLPMHPYAKVAAYYADAAAAIGRFPQVEQALFVHQAQWAATGKVEPIVAAALSPAHAREVETLARTPEVQRAVQHDLRQGQALGIDETPTMYITHNGKRTPIIGVVSYPVLRQYINALLHQ
jgi:protein-disulfide isomerase